MDDDPQQMSMDSAVGTPRVRQRLALGTRHVSMMSLSTMNQAPRWSMSTGRRNSSTDRRPIVPDPGSYAPLDPSTTSKMSRSSRAGFGSNTGSRQLLKVQKESEIPGPGAYSHQVNDDLGQVPRQTAALISTPRARERPMRSSTPDPGSYMPVDPKSTSKMGSSPSFGFASSRQSRFPMLKERAPGPGSYANRGEIGFKEGPSFLSSPRQRERAAATSPEPGSYHTSDPGVTSRMVRSPRAHFSSRSSTGRLPENGDIVRKNELPGPGAYAHKEILGNEVAGTNFVRSTQRKQTKVRGESPDPGIYAAVDPGITSKMSKQASYGFSNLSTGRNPENGDKIMTNGSVDENGNAVSPYLNGSTRSPRGSLGNDNPGPGSYEVVYAAPAALTASPRWGFAVGEARPGLSTSRSTAMQAPGPGTYTKNTSVGVGPKFSMRGRSEDRRSSTPGPGSYGGHYTQFIS